MKPDFEEKDPLSPGRLKWACRRGMLELDVLLGNFLDNAYAQLSEADQALFVRFLGCTDPELFSWLMGRSVPADPELARMTGMIRRHANDRL